MKCNKIDDDDDDDVMHEVVTQPQYTPMELNIPDVGPMGGGVSTCIQPISSTNIHISSPIHTLIEGFNMLHFLSEKASIYSISHIFHGGTNVSWIIGYVDLMRKPTKMRESKN